MDAGKAEDPRAKSNRYSKNARIKFDTNHFDFLHTQFLIDANYVGEPPHVQVSIDNLNDNIDENFLKRDLSKFGKIRTLEIVRHPETRQHLGLAKVQFEDVKVARSCVDSFNGKHLMGRQLSVFKDVRFAIIEKIKKDKLNPNPVIAPIFPSLMKVVPPALAVGASTVVAPLITPGLPPGAPPGLLPFLQQQQKLNPPNSPDTASASRGRLEDRIAILMKQPNCVLSTIVSAHISPNSISTSSSSQKPLDNNKSRSSDHQHHSQQHPHHHSQLPPHHRQSRSDRDDHYHNNHGDNSSRLHNSRSDSYSDHNSDDDQLTSRGPLKIKLTERQIEEEVLPYCYGEFYKELSANLLSTLFKMLKEKHGYECLEKAQQAHKEKQDKLKIQREKEKLKLEQEKLFERRYMSKARAAERPTEAPRPRVNLIRQRTSDNGVMQDKRRHGEADLRRVNRSSAYEPEKRGSHNTSINSDFSDNGSSSSASSFSSSSSSSASSRSYSSSSASSSSSSCSSRSSSPVSRFSASSDSSSEDENDKEYKVKLTTPKPPKPQVETTTNEIERDNFELAAAEALLDMGGHGISDNKFPNEIDDEVMKRPPKAAGKKRKAPSKNVTSVASEYRAAKKFAKDTSASTDGVPVYDENIENAVDENLEDDRMEAKFMYPKRSDKEKHRMLHDLAGTLTDEDVKFLHEVHAKAQLNTTNEVQIPFGSEIANKAHLNVRKSMIDGKTAGHPKWWTGCSRCDVIVVSEKEKVQEEEMNYDDLTKAPIKSHVIQAAPSSRRDQRGDQRRIAVLNPNIDDKLIKMYTTSTLQMRAKNLRFSRSKIHKWGLFACEKIANGDAVIEYVGEKIRPSLADHREKVVYTNLPTHDGSSYFFRVDYDVIDATLRGNKARFINHSCNPNCFAKVIKHDNGTNSIVIYAKQVIQEDEEITYDYKFPREENEEKIRCNCRAPNCQKYLN